MILSGDTIRTANIFEPFCERTTHESGLTYGLGPAGYDVRIAESFTLPSGRFCLASTMERFTIPNYLLCVIHDKSTWARVGLALQNTVAEPGWSGYLTLELTNHGEDDLVLVRGMPIAQAVFHRLDQPASVAYDGRYQDQKAGPQPAIWMKDRGIARDDLPLSAVRPKQCRFCGIHAETICLTRMDMENHSRRRQRCADALAQYLATADKA